MPVDLRVSFNPSKRPVGADGKGMRFFRGKRDIPNILPLRKGMTPAKVAAELGMSSVNPLLSPPLDRCAVLQILRGEGSVATPLSEEDKHINLIGLKRYLLGGGSYQLRVRGRELSPIYDEQVEVIASRYGRPEIVLEPGSLEALLEGEKTFRERYDILSWFLQSINPDGPEEETVPGHFDDDGLRKLGGYFQEHPESLFFSGLFASTLRKLFPNSPEGRANLALFLENLPHDPVNAGLWVGKVLNGRLPELNTVEERDPLAIRVGLRAFNAESLEDYSRYLTAVASDMQVMGFQVKRPAKDAFQVLGLMDWGGDFREIGGLVMKVLPADEAPVVQGRRMAQLVAHVVWGCLEMWSEYLVGATMDSDRRLGWDSEMQKAFIVSGAMTLYPDSAVLLGMLLGAIGLKRDRLSSRTPEMLPTDIVNFLKTYKQLAPEVSSQTVGGAAGGMMSIIVEMGGWERLTPHLSDRDMFYFSAKKIFPEALGEFMTEAIRVSQDEKTKTLLRAG